MKFLFSMLFCLSSLLVQGGSYSSSGSFNAREVAVGTHKKRISAEKKSFIDSKGNIYKIPLYQSEHDLDVGAYFNEKGTIIHYGNQGILLAQPDLKYRLVNAKDFEIEYDRENTLPILLLGQINDSYYTAEILKPVEPSKAISAIKEPNPIIRESKEVITKKILQQYSFKNYKPGDKVEFVVDEKEYVSGTLIELTERGINIEATPGAVVLFAKKRLTLESRAKFYKKDYDTFINAEIEKRTNLNKE